MLPQLGVGFAVQLVAEFEILPVVGFVVELWFVVEPEVVPVVVVLLVIVGEEHIVVAVAEPEAVPVGFELRLHHLYLWSTTYELCLNQSA